MFDDPDNCEHSSGAYRVAFPDAWWWNTEYEHDELGYLDACQYFSTQEFDLSAASVERPIERDVSVYIQYLDGACFGYTQPILGEEEVEIDGYDAEVLRLGASDTDEEVNYQYLVRLDSSVGCGQQTFIVATTGIDMVGDYEENKAILDQMMETMEISGP